MIINSNTEENAKIKFFEAIANENIPDIIQFLKNESYEVWNFLEEEDYTGNFSLHLSFASSCFYEFDFSCHHNYRSYESSIGDKFKENHLFLH